jgi:type II restriction/modification system DNA methylase subunit YeeA
MTASDDNGVGVDLTKAAKLPENACCAFVATVKAGPFDIPGNTARAWLKLPNPNGRSNADVLRPWANGLDVSRRSSDTWIIDFGVDMAEANAAMYETPFAYVREKVHAQREASTKETKHKHFWLMARPIPAMRRALAPLSRYIATPADGKQRVFAWLSVAVLPDHQLVVIARDDDAMFGMVHSYIHEIWSFRAEISRMGVGNTPRYKPPVHFEKFPFPDGLTPNIPAAEHATDPRAARIATAARALAEARDRWLNPPEWTERLPEVVPGVPDQIVPKAGHEAELKKRTLTNLYNVRPAWLEHLHRELDRAVATAYGWEWPLADEEILRRLFELNQARAAQHTGRSKES